MGFEPDRRLQQVIRLVFKHFRELGSDDQVPLSMTGERIHFPRPSGEDRMADVEWLPIRNRDVIAISKNPF